MTRHTHRHLTRGSRWLMAILTLSVLVLSGTNLRQLVVAKESIETESEAPSVTTPTDVVLQEMHDLLAETTKLRIDKRFQNQFLAGGKQVTGADRKHHARAAQELTRITNRLTAISSRLQEIHDKELGQFERVAEHAALACSEEPRYGQPSYEIILDAKSIRPIRANELLLFHAGGVYRTQGEFQPLRSTGQGFYFRPNVNVPNGQQFTVACIQDAAEEIANVKNGFMPNSDRARDPGRPYRTQIFGRDGKPLAVAE